MKAKDKVDMMTLAEKTNITSGTGIYMGTYIDLTLQCALSTVF